MSRCEAIVHVLVAVINSSLEKSIVFFLIFTCCNLFYLFIFRFSLDHTTNSVLCTACGKWVHARCTDTKKVSVYLNKDFVCKKCRSVVKNFKGSDKKLCDGMETVSKFTYLGDRMNATGGCETAVTAISRIGWIKFRECSEILTGKRFFIEDERKNLQKLCKISYVVWK